MSSSVLAALQRHAKESPGRIALRGDEVVSYGDLWQRVQRVADWLRTTAATRIALEGENGAAWVVADLAAWLAGVVMVPVPSFFSPAQRAHVLAAAGVDGVLSCAEGADTGVAGLRWQPLTPPGARAALADGVCKITFTSGTTGTPKGVCLDTATLDAVARALAQRIHAAPGLSDAVDTHFTMLPLATLLENVAGVYVPLSLGKAIALHAGPSIGLVGSSGLDPARLLRALHAARPHSLIVLPQILHALVLAAEQGHPAPDLLRFVAVGGSRTPLALLQRAAAVGLPVFEGYGLSECASVVALNAPGACRPGSVGRPLDHVRVRVRDGVIEVAGTLFSGYLGQPAPARDAWLDTGDLGHLDVDGYLHITGRRKHVLITSFGRNVSPEWVESELALLPSIRQVLVTGDDRPTLTAIVVPAPGADAATVAADLRRANATLPDYARIGRVVLATEPFLPSNGLLTDNGRPRRDAILARHAGALAALDADSDPTPTLEPLHDLL